KRLESAAKAAHSKTTPAALTVRPARTRVRRASCQLKPEAHPPRRRVLPSQESGADTTNPYTRTATQVVHPGRSSIIRAKNICDSVRASSPKLQDAHAR